MKPLSDEQKIAVDRTLLKLVAYITNRKMETSGTVLVPDATAGFNLACDFLSHEIRKMREMTDWDVETKSYSSAYTFHEETE